MIDDDVTKLNLISIDQSLTGTGIAAFYDGQLHIQRIKTEKRDKNLKSPSIDKTRRIRRIRNRIKVLCESVKFNYGIIEGMSYGSRGNVIFDLGGLSHMIRDVFLEYGIQFAIIPPKTAKKYWTGNGNSNKKELVEETKKRGITIPFGFDDNCNDAYIFLDFLINLLKGELSEDVEDKVEKSWEP